MKLLKELNGDDFRNYFRMDYNYVIEVQTTVLQY